MAASDGDTIGDDRSWRSSTSQESYVDKVDDKTLIRAIDGMFSLDLPSYMDAVDFQNMKIPTGGNYGGLGCRSRCDGAVKVIAPQEIRLCSAPGSSKDYHAYRRPADLR